MFSGFLALRPACTVCGLDLDFADAGDGPAVFVILIAGFLLLFGMLFTSKSATIRLPQRCSQSFCR